eukprot:2197537-Pleurochrysis_carterae.AAC.1
MRGGFGSGARVVPRARLRHPFAAQRLEAPRRAQAPRLAQARAWPWVTGAACARDRFQGLRAKKVIKLKEVVDAALEVRDDDDGGCAARADDDACALRCLVLCALPDTGVRLHAHGAGAQAHRRVRPLQERTRRLAARSDGAPRLVRVDAVWG